MTGGRVARERGCGAGRAVRGSPSSRSRSRRASSDPHRQLAHCKTGGPERNCTFSHTAPAAHHASPLPGSQPSLTHGRAPSQLGSSPEASRARAPDGGDIWLNASRNAATRRFKHSARNSGRSSLSYPPTRGRAGASLLWGFSPLELGRSGNSHCEWRADADSWTLGDLDAAARRWRRGQVWRRPRRPRNRALAVGRLRARLGAAEV